MVDDKSFFDQIGTGRGIETVGDVMREKKRSEENEKRNFRHQRITIWISLVMLVLTVISIILIIKK